MSVISHPTTVLEGVSQALELAIGGSYGTRPLIPRTAVLVRVLEALELAHECSAGTRPFVPRAADLLAGMLQAFEVTNESSAGTCPAVEYIFQRLHGPAQHRDATRHRQQVQSESALLGPVPHADADARRAAQALEDDPNVVRWEMSQVEDEPMQINVEEHVGGADGRRATWLSTKRFHEGRLYSWGERHLSVDVSVENGRFYKNVNQCGFFAAEPNPFL